MRHLRKMSVKEKAPSSNSHSLPRLHGSEANVSLHQNMDKETSTPTDIISEALAGLGFARIVANQSKQKFTQDENFQNAIDAFSGCLSFLFTELSDVDEQELHSKMHYLKVYSKLFSQVNRSVASLLTLCETSPPKEAIATATVDHQQAKRLIAQLVAQEANFVFTLEQIVGIQVALNKRDDELIPKSDQQIIFSQVDELLLLHKEIYEDLKNALKCYPACDIGNIFLDKGYKLLTYKRFIANSHDCQQCAERLLKEKKGFSNFIKSFSIASRADNFNLLDLLKKPVRRIEDYICTLEEIVKVLPPAKKEKVKEAQDLFGNLISSIDACESVADNLAKIAEVSSKIEGLNENLVRPDRKFVYEGAFKVLVTGAKKPIAEYGILFNDILIYCQGSGKIMTYTERFFLHQLQFEYVSSKNQFNLVVNEKEKYTVLVPDETQCHQWNLHLTKAIREVERTRKVFGVPLNTLMKREAENDIPTFVDKSIHFIYDYGLEKVGLFRQTGRATQISKLKDQLNQGANVFFSDNMDVHSVADLFKLWLRELPEPLLTWKAYDQFIECIQPEVDKEKQVELLKAVVKSLPRNHRYVTQHMFKCLKAICDNEPKTKMNSTNLAVVFAPNILKSPDPNIDLFDHTLYENQNAVFTTMLNNYSTIFGSVEAKRAKGVPRRKGSKRIERVRSRIISSPLSSSMNSSNEDIAESSLFHYNNKKWCTKLCKIEANYLVIRKKATDKKVQRIFLTGCQIASAIGCEKPFSISVVGNDKETILATKSGDEQELWLDALRKAAAIE